MTTLTLSRLLATTRPESHGGTRGTTWPAHARYLWTTAPTYMAELLHHMARHGWPAGPVILDGEVAQDGHHRVVTAACLGWRHRPIPIHRLTPRENV